MIERRFKVILKYIYAKQINEYNEINWDEKTYRINHFDQIPLKHYQVIIIMSQLDKDELKWIENHSDFDYLFFVGVRDYLPGENTKRFANETQLNQHLLWAENRKQKREESWFVSQLPLVDESDQVYLENILLNDTVSGQMPKPKKRLKFSLGRKRKSFKGMVTVVSEGNEVVQITEKLRHLVTGKILLIDGDLLKPSLDMYYGISDIESRLDTHLLPLDATGFNVLHDAVHKQMSLDDYIEEIVHPIDNHLHLLLGNYNFYNYEHYHLHYFQVMLDYLKNEYDLVIMKCPYEIYDEWTLLSLILSDMNLFISQNHLADVRYLYQLKSLLEVKQEIPEKKNYFSFHQDKLKRLNLTGKNYSSHALSLLFKKQYGGFYSTKQSLKLLKRGLRT